MTVEFKQTRKNSKALVEDKSLHLLSPIFGSHDEIPEKYTFMGENISPPLVVENVPFWAQTLILVLEDLDAPNRFINWFVTDIDPMISYIDEDISPGRLLYNSAKEKSYYGPTPLQGTHTYRFTIYAVDDVLPLPENIDMDTFKQMLDKVVYDKAELIGTVCCGKIRAIE